MLKYQLTQKGNVPAVFEGEALTALTIGSQICSNVHVFRTKAGEVLLYVGSVGSQTTRAIPQRLYRNANQMTNQDVVVACHGLVDYAQPALTALGLNTTETIN